MRRSPLSFGAGALVLLAGAALTAGACSISPFGSSESAPASDGTVGDADGQGAGPSTGTGGTGVAEPPAEMELEESFRAPVVSGEALWTANPETNKVARIFADSMEIEVLEGGHAPTFLAALPAGATPGGALVLNARSHDASVFLEDDDGALVVSERLAVQEGASAWTVGKGGKRAIAWSQAAQDGLQGADGYQDLTVFSFAGSEVETTELSVGFRPSRVFIDDDESHAYVVSDPGISVIDFEDGAFIEREIFLPTEAPSSGRDVTITPDGSLAYVRQQGSSEVLLVRTESGDRVSVSLPGVVTDLDLSADGSRAFAVVRGDQAGSPNLGGASGLGGVGGMGGALEPGVSWLAILETDEIFDAPKDYEIYAIDDVVGSVVVGSAGDHALLFTNAIDNPRLHLFDRKAAEARIVDLKAPILAGFLSENAEFAVALMKPPVGSTKAGAFALVPIQQVLPARIEGTAQAPAFVTLVEEAGRALITTQADTTGRASTYFAHFPGLRVDTVPLPSRPLASGVVLDADRAFVAQQHPEGRVTFLDLSDGAETTLTGFELGSKVVR